MSSGVANYCSESVRQQSFFRAESLWPHPITGWAACPKTLAKAGFYLNKVSGEPGSDNVTCFMCRTSLDGWRRTDDPLTEHLQHAPRCSWARLLHSEAEYRKAAAAPSDSKGDDEDGEHKLHDMAATITGQDMCALRLETFTVGKWPHDGKRGWKCGAKAMAAAGFVMTPPAEDGDDLPDMATCLYCGLALDRWEKGDNPATEHKKRAPECIAVLKTAAKRSRVTKATQSAAADLASTPMSTRKSKRGRAAADEHAIDCTPVPLGRKQTRRRANDAVDVEDDCSFTSTVSMASTAAISMRSLDTDDDADLAPPASTRKLRSRKGKSNVDEDLSADTTISEDPSAATPLRRSKRAPAKKKTDSSKAPARSTASKKRGKVTVTKEVVSESQTTFSADTTVVSPVVMLHSPSACLLSRNQKDHQDHGMVVDNPPADGLPRKDTTKEHSGGTLEIPTQTDSLPVADDCVQTGTDASSLKPNSSSEQQRSTSNEKETVERAENVRENTSVPDKENIITVEAMLRRLHEREISRIQERTAVLIKQFEDEVASATALLTSSINIVN